MKNGRDVEALVSQMDLKSGSKRAVVQYGRGMLDGMHMAYVSVARKMLLQGRSEQEVRRFLAGLADTGELRTIIAEAKGNK